MSFVRWCIPQAWKFAWASIIAPDSRYDNGRFCFPAGLRQQPDFLAREARRRGASYLCRSNTERAFGSRSVYRWGFSHHGWRLALVFSLCFYGGGGGVDHRQRDFSPGLKRKQDRMAMRVVGA